VLICLYGKPVLHVDIKFLEPPELAVKVEDPVIVWERGGVVTEGLNSTAARWPFPGFQWIEDRFWVWVHYTAAKLGGGEFLETLEAISYL